MEAAIKKLFKYSIPEPNTGCLLWYGAQNSDGYGNVYFQGKNWKAHRLSYFVNYGDIKNYICHKCDTPQCINPEHLFDGTQKENMDDARSKKRQYKLKSQCKNGHAFTEKNIRYQYGKGYRYRVCKTCVNQKYLKRKNKGASHR